MLTPRGSRNGRRALSRMAISALALTCAALAPPAQAGPSKDGLRVTSTLDGKTVLPHRIHWLAFPHLAGAQAAKVDFVIDGKVRWTERQAPYTYSDDGGFLVTSFLSPGRHRFTVRMRTSDGHVLSDTVRARVLPAPAPPALLEGMWRHDVANAVPADPGASADQPVPAGTWTMVFDKRWLETTAPGTFDPVASKTSGLGYIIDNDYTPGPTSFHIAGSVTIGPVVDADPRGGWWCEAWGPPTDYSWSVSGDTLTVAPAGGSDPCHQRGAILTGQWTRVT
jgi:hypothetical protein